MKVQLLIPVFILVSFLQGCNDPESVVAKEEEKKDSVEITLEKKEKNKKELKKYTQLTDQPGPIGIFEVPEMLTLCRKDSAASSKMAEAFAKNYTLLEKDMELIGMQAAGAAGSIYYNNDTSNFIFEVVYPLASMPKKTPKKSTIVVLEASPMVIYNYYGEYSELYKAYAAIKKYLDDNALEQSGPLREFYITDPVKVKDHSQWLTRVMVPVMNKK
jgi:effector-binding domain-containing protein